MNTREGIAVERTTGSPSCPVCEDGMAVHYQAVQDAITGDIFAVYKCPRCGAGRTVPVPEDLTRYYDNVYYGGRHGVTERYCINRRLKLVSSTTRKTWGKRLLDIGCGDGAFIRRMREAGWDAAGTEINPHVEAASGMVIREHVEEFSEYDPFDCVTMWHTLEHMRDISTTLTQVNNLLKPDGSLIIAVPNSNSFQSMIFKDKWLHLDVPRHLHHFDAISLQTCLRENGFVVLKQKYQELEYDMIGWAQSALNCIFTRPNIFFDITRGKHAGVGLPAIMANLCIGPLLLVLSVPAVILERLFKRSGTIITIAGKAD